MVDFKSPKDKEAFNNLILDMGGKCCIIDAASAVSGVAKFLVEALKAGNIDVSLEIYIWFIGILFVQVLKDEMDKFGNHNFICIIRECSIIPKEVLESIGFEDETLYICKILYRLKSRILDVLGENCTFKIVGADTKQEGCKHRREVDDALCILLSAHIGESHILTCDGYRSFLPKGKKGKQVVVKFSELTIKKCGSGSKFKAIASLSDVDVESRNCHMHRAGTFRKRLRAMCAAVNYQELYEGYLETQKDRGS